MQLGRVAGVNTTCASHLEMLQLELCRAKLRQGALELAWRASPSDDVSALFESFCEMLSNPSFCEQSVCSNLVGNQASVGFCEVFRRGLAAGDYYNAVVPLGIRKQSDRW